MARADHLLLTCVVSPLAGEVWKQEMEGAKGWGHRGRRTSGNLKPRRVDEEKLAFLREAYEPDEEHLVAEALFDLANMFEEEEEEEEEAMQPQHASPALNGKRTRKGFPANLGAPAFAAQQPPRPMMRTYSQQRASPLPHNTTSTHKGPTAAAANGLLVAQQQQQQPPQQQPQPQPQQHPQLRATVGQAAHASTHPQLHGNVFPQQSYFAAGASGLPGSGPFFMPPYSHLQLPPGALSGKLATTLLPNGSPVPLAFGPNGTLMPLSGAWPLHPQQRQQHPAALAQQMQPPLGLAGGLPFVGTTVTTGLSLPGMGTSQAGLTQGVEQQGIKMEVALPGAGLQGPGVQGNLPQDQQQPGSRPHAGSAFASQEQQGAPERAKAEHVKAYGSGAGTQASLKRCALHVRIAHMIMERQRQQGGGGRQQQQQQQQQQVPSALPQTSQGQQAQHVPEPQQDGFHRPRSSSPPSTEPNGLVRQHSAGSTSTCPSAPSTLTDTNTSPASTRAPHAPQALPQARAQQPAAAGSPGKEATNTTQLQGQECKGSTAEPAPHAAAKPAPQGPQAAAPASTLPLSMQQQYLLQLLQQQRQQQQQQLQHLAVSSSPGAFPFGSFLQGLPAMGMSQPLLPSLPSGLPGTSAAHINSSFGFPAALLGLPLHPSQHLPQQHLHHLPPQNGAYGGGSMGLQQVPGVPPHLLAQVMGLPGLMNMAYPGGQQYHAPGIPAFSLPMPSSPATPAHQQQQPQQQRPQAPTIGLVGGSGGSLPISKQATHGPQVH